LFGGSKDKERLESLLDDLARSYLPGHIKGSPEGRSEICNEISEIASRLKADGQNKLVTKARSFRPTFFPGLPRESQQDWATLVSQALA
jgi:hypothetical protein